MRGFFCISQKKYYITQYNSCAILESYSSRPDRSAREASSDPAIYCHNITKFSTFPNISGGKKKYTFQTKINLHNSTFIRIFVVNKITIMRKKTYRINECEDWLFIEQNLPNYESRNDILYNDIVNRYVSGEEIDSHDAEMMQNDFSSFEEAEKWLDKDFKRLFLEAVEAVLEEGRLEAITCVKK